MICLWAEYCQFIQAYACSFFKAPQSDPLAIQWLIRKTAERDVQSVTYWGPTGDRLFSSCTLPMKPDILGTLYTSTARRPVSIVLYHSYAVHDWFRIGV